MLIVQISKNYLVLYSLTVRYIPALLSPENSYYDKAKKGPRCTAEIFDFSMTPFCMNVGRGVGGGDGGGVGGGVGELLG